ncbi:hypothetical protein GCM10010470_10900 [Saccharopolyspora taberi]|uniref:Alpha/beta hydrolase n=1 Tax=Saccharopolyspora taberi TaxID=60895 RepID=A0ABN3V7T8_9PSEU
MSRRLAAAGAAESLRLGASLLAPLLPWLPVPARLLQHSGLMRPGGDPEAVTAAVRRFLEQEWRWYLGLAGRTTRWELGGLDCPVTVLTGRHDLLADLPAVNRAVASLPQARLRILPTSHFIPFEAPADLRDELLLLLHRVQTVECARLGLEPPPPRMPRIRWRVPEVGFPRRPVPYRS